MTAEDLRRLDPKELDDLLSSLSVEELQTLQYDWKFWARPNQLPPPEWGHNGCFIWNIRAGRGFGKTRSAAETFRDLIATGKYMHTSLCGATAEEVRDIMINGESGLLACCPPWFSPRYVPSKKKLHWPNGAVTSIFYGSEPEKSRGAQSDLLWCDEIHKWQYPEDTFDNLLFGLRLGPNPLCIVTSTPKPTKFTRELEKRVGKDGEKCVVTTTGSTYDNAANLSPVFYSTIISKYEGTRLGEQELNAQIMDDNPNALFKREWIARDRVYELPPDHTIRRVVVGVDPATTHKENSNHTGIILIYEGWAPKELASGMEVRNKKMTHYYIIRDHSIAGTPLEWGARCKMASKEAGVLVIEDNQGGDMVESTLDNAGVTCRIERVHAVKDKATRAMPVSTIMEQGRIHFYRDPKTYNEKEGDNLDILEDELCNWIPGEDSPDRMDAMVHAINYCEPGDDTMVDRIMAFEALKYLR